MDRFGLNAESGFDTTLFELDTLTGLPYWVEMDVKWFWKEALDFDLSSLECIHRFGEPILFRLNISNGFPNEVMSPGLLPGCFR